MPRSLPQASTSKAAASTSASTLTRIQAHEASLASTPSDLNPVGSLLDIFSASLPTSLDAAPSSEQEKVAHASAYALHRVFSSLLRQGRLHGRLRSSAGAEAEAESVKKVREWLKKLYDEYTDSLAGLLGVPGEQHRLRLDALAVLTSLTRTESDVRRTLAGSTQTASSSGTAKAPTHFAKELWAKVIKGLLVPCGEGGKTPTDVRAEFVLRYFNFCDDLRYHTLKAIDSVSASYHGRQPPPEYISNVLNLLESLTSMPTQPSELNEFWCGRPAIPAPTESAKRKAKAANRARKRAKSSAPKDEEATGIFDDSSDEESDDAPAVPTLSSKDLPPLLSLSAHRKVFSSAWLSFLSLPLSPDHVKRVLAILHRLVLPNMTDPKLLMDFLVDAADQGGVVGLLALDGLFTLISKHNLDYPGFFEKLYALLDRNVLHVRYRPRFLRMLNTFLSSTHLPAVLVASFVKRLARLSLSAPPAAIVSVIPFCYNLLKRHPSCMGMLHRDGWPDNLTSDPYVEDESDPLKTNALSSSLWELASLRNHYLASVATLAKIFGEAFDKPGYDLEDFLDHSYGSLFETEVKRQMRRPPALSMEVSSGETLGELFPTKPLGDDVGEAGLERDIVGQMWVF